MHLSASIIALLSPLLSPSAWAQEDELDLDALMAEMDLGSAGGLEELSYSGDRARQATDYVAGKPVTVTHNGGDVEVLCSDREGISARLIFELSGTNPDAMQAMGDGIGLTAWGSASSGGVKARTPARRAGVSDVSIKLTVNLPREARVTVYGGGGTVDVLGCTGTVKVSSRGGGIVATGTYTQVNLAAGKGDITAHLGAGSVLSGTNVVTAPAGWISLKLPLSYAGRLHATAEEVTVDHVVVGTNDAGLVSGTVNEGKAHLKVTALSTVEIRDAD
jgi:hypothetical protein